jgi:high-affinity Fe2+/Pb2+ permease
MFALSLDSAKNVAIVVAVVFVVLSLLSAWIVKNIVMKMILVVVLAGLALGAWTQRQNLADCADQAVAGFHDAVESGISTPDSVTCNFFGTDVDVPAP